MQKKRINRKAVTISFSTTEDMRDLIDATCEDLSKQTGKIVTRSNVITTAIIGFIRAKLQYEAQETENAKEKENN